MLLALLIGAILSIGIVYVYRLPKIKLLYYPEGSISRFVLYKNPTRMYWRPVGGISYDASSMTLQDLVAEMKQLFEEHNTTTLHAASISLVSNDDTPAVIFAKFSVRPFREPKLITQYSSPKELELLGIGLAHEGDPVFEMPGELTPTCISEFLVDFVAKYIAGSAAKRWAVARVILS